MTREETRNILHILVATYPNFRPADMRETVDIWHNILGEYGYRNIEIAVKKYILSDTSGFAPSIGQIVAAMQENAETGGLSELAAWQMVSKAISRSGYYAEEEFAKLPDVVQRAVGGPANLHEWALMDSGSVHSVVQSHFIRSFRVTEKKMADEAKLPPKFLAQVMQMQAIPERLAVKEPQPQIEDRPKEISEFSEETGRRLEELKRRLKVK